MPPSAALPARPAAPQPAEDPAPAPSALRAWLRRELLILGAAVAVGVIIMPALIFAAGSRYLGPYPAGSLGALVKNFLRGLVEGGAAFWWVALGPYACVIALRLLVALIRRIGWSEPADTPD